MAPATITIIGLVCDIVGVACLFCFAPEKFADPQTRAFFKVEEKLREQWLKRQAIRRRMAILSLVLVVVGFSLQLLGEVVATGWLDL